MLNGIQEQWNELKRLPHGERFQRFHERQRGKSLAVKAAYAGGSVLLFGAGVLFAFIPGPAVLFFALCAALLAAQSSFVARRLDSAEVWGRKQLARLRRAWATRRRARARANGRRRVSSSAALGGARRR